MSNLTLPLGFDPTAFVQNTKAAAQKTFYWAGLVLLGCLGALCVLMLAWTLEVVLTYTVIEANFGPEFPDDPVPMKVYILSFASICAILAFHSLMLGQRDHPIAVWLRRIARVMLLVFFVGMALLFLTTDMTTQPLALNDAELFGESESASNGVWAMIQPFVSMTSALALGGLVFINLALSDAILSWVSRMLPAKSGELRDAHAIIKSANAIETMDTLYGDLEREEGHLAKTNDETLALEVASRISDAALPTVQSLHETVQEADLIPPASNSLLGKTAKAKVTPEIDELKTFLTDWEAFTDELPSTLRRL